MACVGVLTLFPGAPASRAQSVAIALSHVGDPGNAPDPATGYGRVDYSYDIGTYDVTLDQYAAFLNAVAKTDPYGLYNSLMATSGNYIVSDDLFSFKDYAGVPTGAGIERSGASGGCCYSVIGISGNDPVSGVSWFDAARFCNWLQNGQPKNLGETAGSTETGAYTLNRDMTNGPEVRNGRAKWWIPSENEWYKAAYYDPKLSGGAGGYWRYATQSNIAPGNRVGGGPNEANYIDASRDEPAGVYCVTQAGDYSPSQNYLTPVGSFTDSASYYGTYDQNGDVEQWNDAIISGSGQYSSPHTLLGVLFLFKPAQWRGVRGGCWRFSWASMQSTRRSDNDPSGSFWTNGFRVAGPAESAPRAGVDPAIALATEEAESKANGKSR